MLTAEQVAAKFWSTVRKSDGCWEWTALLNVHGYGRFWISYVGHTTAHRFSWELANGPVPEGRVVMHSCDNRKCVNPAHLSIGSQRDNLLDASQKRRLPNQQKTHCYRGHPLSGDNVRPRYGRAGRTCIACSRLNAKAHKQREKLKRIG